MSYYTSKDLKAARMTPDLEQQLARIIAHPCESDLLICALWNELLDRNEKIRQYKTAAADVRETLGIVV